MASPVDTSVKHFRSDTLLALGLTGNSGRLTSILNACLVDGYGTKTATSLVVTSGVATLTFTGGASAAWAHCVITVDGVTGAMTDLNGEQRVIAAGGTTVTFPTDLADGTAAGTITFKIAPAGWEKVFSGTNAGVYRSTDVLGTRMYLKVNDNMVRYARAVAYETMSDINSGTGPFPTDSQISGGGFWPKNGYNGVSNVPWFLVADSRFFHVCVMVGCDQPCFGTALRGFGDLVPVPGASADYLCVLNSSFSEPWGGSGEAALDSGSATARTALARGYAGFGAAVVGTAKPYSGGEGVSGMNTAFGAYPSVVDGALYLSDVFVADSATSPPRGKVPGLKYCPQSGAWGTFKMLDTVPTGGRIHLVANPTDTFTSTSSAANTGVSLVDITGPWR